MSRIIAHVDMDAFFAAIEQRDNPEFRGKPVIVGALPGGRGVVSTASYEARKFGIRSAMPISSAYRRCPQGVYVRPDFARYKAASEHIEAIFREFSPVTAMVSIDEAYLDLTGLATMFGSPRETAEKIKRRVRAETGLTASIGIGPNRLIAKIASDYQKPDGLTVVEHDAVAAFLAPLAASKIPGIGAKTFERLESMGVHTIGDLARWERDALVRRFGESQGDFLFRKSRGLGSDVIGEGEDRKSISKEHTFESDVADESELRKTLLRIASDLGRSMRREEISGRAIHLKIRLRGFETHTVSRTMDESIQDDRRIFEFAWRLYEGSSYVGRPVRLIGIGLSDLRTSRDEQLGLFDGAARVRDGRLYGAMDKIRDRFGKRSILPADVFPAEKKSKPQSGKD